MYRTAGSHFGADPHPQHAEAVRASTQAKVKAHSEKLRAQGLRPVQIWVPDIRAPGFAEDARRQCRLANASSHAKDDQAFIESVSWLTIDDTR